jgi:hypothetical protein
MGRSRPVGRLGRAGAAAGVGAGVDEDDVGLLLARVLARAELEVAEAQLGARRNVWVVPYPGGVFSEGSVQLQPIATAHESTQRADLVFLLVAGVGFEPA